MAISKLKAKPPGETSPSHAKLIIYGKSGVGKSWLALTFPNVYYIDCESGASLDHYQERLKKAGGAYLGVEDGALDFETVIGQIQALATERHQYKTVVIDSLTQLYQTTISLEAERLGSKDAFGASKKPAVAFMRRLLAWCSKLDMNVIFVCHQTAEWGINPQSKQREEIGAIPDVWDKTVYTLDLTLEIQKRGPQRLAIVRKSRLTGFPEGESFESSYPEFAQRYGKDFIESAPVPIVLITEDQLTQIQQLLEVVKVEEDFMEKYLEKAQVEKKEEFTTEQGAKIIAFLTKKLPATATK